MLLFRRISLGSGSAVACGRCPAPPSRSYRPAEEIGADIAAGLGVSGARGIVFDGPEPFSHPELPVLIGRAVQAGADRVGIATTAAALAHGENAPGSIAAGVRLIEVSLLGPDPATHDVRAIAPGGFDAARAGVARFVSAAQTAGVEIAVRGRIPVCPHTADTLPQTVVALVSWGASSISLACDDEPDRGTLAQMRAACETGTVNGVWVTISGVEPHLLGSDALHAVDPLTFVLEDRQ